MLVRLFVAHIRQLQRIFDVVVLGLQYVRVFTQVLPRDTFANIILQTCLHERYALQGELYGLRDLEKTFFEVVSQVSM